MPTRQYTLINCYSDNNRGDLAIIVSTINLIQEFDSNAEISGISTYNSSDPWYESEHKILKKYMHVFPSIYGVVNFGRRHSTILKIIRFFYDSLRMLASILLPRNMVKYLYSKSEVSSIKQILNSDYIVSKGGSFICSGDDIRSQIALIRLLYIFILCIKLNKPPIILCQSIGPYSGWLVQKLTNYVLTHCSAVVLREDVCIEKYTYIKLPDKVFLSTDIAFFAKSIDLPLDINFSEERFRIGMTIKHVDIDQSEDYLNMFVMAIEYCIQHYDAKIYVFPHVTIDNDIDNSFEVYKRLSDQSKQSIVLLSDSYNALHLKSIYKNMDVFIGTRLHSTIFAISEDVPSICVTYHGTKALGVFKTIKMQNYVITDYDSEKLIELIVKLINNKVILKKRLSVELHKKRKELEYIFSEIFNRE